MTTETIERKKTPTEIYRSLTPEQHEIAKKNGIPKPTLRNRFKSGFSVEQAINLPLGTHRKYEEGVERTFEEEDFQLAKQLGISRGTVRSRYHGLGYSKEEAITLPLGGKYKPRQKTDVFTGGKK